MTQNIKLAMCLFVIHVHGLVTFLFYETILTYYWTWSLSLVQFVHSKKIRPNVKTNKTSQFPQFIYFWKHNTHPQTPKTIMFQYGEWNVILLHHQNTPIIDTSIYVQKKFNPTYLPIPNLEFVFLNVMKYL